MPLQPNAVRKPFRKFRRILKRFSPPPAPQDVHSLRTQARHLEAVVHALSLGEKTGGSDLLKDLKPIRKQAGEVRDMDVLIGLASSLHHDAEDHCVVQLLEYLASRRNMAAQKLAKTVAAREPKTSKHLKRCFTLVEDETSSPNANMRDGGKISIKPTALALQLQAELAGWPSFTVENIHPYRLKVKELRYVLELGESGESQFNSALGEVKDQIGAWHDWSQLAKIAKKPLFNGNGRNLLQQIRSRGKSEYGKALELANALQTRYFTGDVISAARKMAPVREISTSAIKETSRLAG